jgi:hypothetical protein
MPNPEETFQQKTQRNFRVKSRYDELMREGKHGHYETMFRVVREEIDRLSASPPEPTREQVEELAHIIDPEAFGLPNNIEDGTITDRDEARDRARLILALSSSSPAAAEKE